MSRTALPIVSATKNQTIGDGRPFGFDPAWPVREGIPALIDDAASPPVDVLGPAVCQRPIVG